MRIIFMGTPEFAVPSLAALVENNFEVVAVVTATDKMGGRGGKQLITPPIKTYAQEHNIPVLQPPKLKDSDFLEELKSYQADLQIVVAFRMLPEVVWNMPPKGTFNLHASLLPEYRGAAPINWAVINGETETGVSTFFLKQEIDTGNLLFQEKEIIYPEDNVGTLYERLMKRGANLVVHTAQAIIDNDYIEIPQDLEKPAKPAPKIHRETCEIDWYKTAQQIHNLVRGLSPYPTAWTTLSAKNCKIYSTSLEIPEGIEADDLNVGSFATDNKSYLLFKTGKGLISIKELQLEGKKRLEIAAFLAGNKF